MDVIIWDFLILFQVFYSLQVKGSMIISNKHGTYMLPHELQNDLKIRILEKYERSRTSLDFIELQTSGQSSS